MVFKLRQHLLQMAPHVRRRATGDLLAEAANEIERLHRGIPPAPPLPPPQNEIPPAVPLHWYLAGLVGGVLSGWGGMFCVYLWLG